MMCTTRIDYTLCLHDTSMECIGSDNRKGKYFSRSIDWLTNQHTILKVLELFLHVLHLLPTSFLDMSNFPTITTCFRLPILLRRWWLFIRSLSRLVDTFYLMIRSTAFFIILLDLSLEQVSLVFGPNIPFFKQLLLGFNQQITKNIKDKFITILLVWHPIGTKGEA